MIKRILLIVLIGFIILFLIVWILGGGPSRIFISLKKGISGGSLPDVTKITLPFQPTNLNIGVDTAQIKQQLGYDSSQPTQQYSDVQNQYDQLQNKVNESQTFGSPSPHHGEVTIRAGGATQSDTAREYVELHASGGNAKKVDLTGWSLQSAVSGTRVYLPQAASLFVLGTVNTLENLSLSPGASAVVTTGSSPVGVSFRQNICSGYLGTLQEFDPPLSNECPSPSDALPETAENLQRYGSSCLSYVQTLPSCEFPQNIPSKLSPSCKAFVADTFSYNGCVAMYRYKSAFFLPSWRLYLGAQSELWDNQHDIIRLLDEKGQTVDVVRY